MPEAVNSGYEGSSEGAVRHWEIPYARLEDVTPTPSNPAAVLAVASDENQVCGTILSIDAGDSVAVIDFTCGMVYRQTVRNVTTYGGAAETVWAAMDIGYEVYYDNSATMPAGTYLSLAAADAATGANPKFGHIMPLTEADRALYPKGGITASTQTVGVMQRGAGS